MNSLRDFFEAERKRVFEPNAFFTARILARLDERLSEGRKSQDLGIWDAVPNSSRPVLAEALMMILCFVIVQLAVPQMPQRGMVESFLGPEQNPAESFLYTGADVASQDLLQQLIASEE
jgi:hypothetical protein